MLSGSKRCYDVSLVAKFSVNEFTRPDSRSGEFRFGLWRNDTPNPHSQPIVLVMFGAD